MEDNKKVALGMVGGFLHNLQMYDASFGYQMDEDTGEVTWAIEIEGEIFDLKDLMDTLAKDSKMMVCHAEVVDDRVDLATRKRMN